MGITWNKEAIERMVAALLAAHPELNPDYKTMAVYFGQGASYDTMQGRFRDYRRTANSMRGNTDGAVASTPSRRIRNPTTTPRSSRGRVTKTTPTSSRNKQSIHRPMASPEATPTKSEKLMKMETDVPEAILIDDDDDEDDDLNFLREENGAGQPLSFAGRINGARGATIKSEPVARMVEVETTSIKREGRIDSRSNGYAPQNEGLILGPSSWPDSDEGRKGGEQPRANQNVEPWEGYDDFDGLA